MKALILLVLAIALFGSGLLIWRGETDREYWATFQTIQGEPSLEIRP